MCKNEIVKKIFEQIRKSYRVYQLYRRFQYIHEHEDIVQDIWQFILNYAKLEEIDARKTNQLIKSYCLNRYKKLRRLEQNREINIEFNRQGCDSFLKTVLNYKDTSKYGKIEKHLYFKSFIEQIDKFKEKNISKLWREIKEDPYITVHVLAKKLGWSVGKVVMIKQKLQKRIENACCRSF